MAPSRATLIMNPPPVPPRPLVQPGLVVAALILLATGPGHPAVPSTPPPPVESLRAATEGRFTLGVGVNDRIPERPADWTLLRRQFAAVTPENCLKPDPVQVAEGQFNFSLADAFVAFATTNQLPVVGHCLVWAKDDRTPAWFFHDGADTASRELLLSRMEQHIRTVVGRYRGRIAAWDVVNEALDDGDAFLRPSGWSRTCGVDFLVRAFEVAHATDPNALLIYNDYNNELPAKRAKLVQLVRLLRERGAPLHAIGLQGHYEIDRVPYDDLEATLATCRELGIKVVVSELDLDVIPRGRWWADGGKYRDELAKLDPYRDGCPTDILVRQADQYARLFRLFRRYSDVIARVSFWDLHDGQSWLNGFPWRRVNYPLLFDRQGAPKPAYHAVVTALTSPSTPAPALARQGAPQPGDADFPTPADDARHAEKVAAVRSGSYDLVLIGDSITHSLGELGGKYEPMKAVWDRHFAPRKAINLGHNGYRTEQILWCLENGELDFAVSPKVAVLLIGTNNTDDRHFPKVHSPEEVFRGTQAIVELIRRRHPTTRILVLRIFPRGGDAEQGVSPPAFNSSPTCIATCRSAGELTARLADGEHVFWLDLNHLFLRPEGMIDTDRMWDLLHPSPAGAEAWAQAMEPTLAGLLGDQPWAVELPTNSALVPTPKLEQDSYDWYARHADVLRVKDAIDPEIILIGDSITHFWGGEPKATLANGPAAWQSTFGPYRTLNLGFGWDRIQNVLWRLDHGELDGLHPRLVVLHIGTNNTSDTPNARGNSPEEIADGMRAILRRLRAKVPDARIILMAVFPREAAPEHPRRRLIGAINEQLVPLGRLPGVTWLDLTPKFLNPDGSLPRELMNDYCHPTEKGYRIWGEALAPLLPANATTAAAVPPDPSLPPQSMELWPQGAPVGDGTTEAVPVRLTLHRAARANGAAIVICPGGGYGGLVTGAEGTGIARWLNQHGIAGAVLEYRLPRGRAEVPLLDAQRAIRTLRAHAAEWGLDPRHIGIIGFSAGGHLASTAATHFDAGQAQAADPVERVSSRPDFAVLVYPVISMGDRGHAGSRQNLMGPAPSADLVKRFSNELQVTDQTPPTYLAHAADDRVVPPDNSQMFHAAMVAHQVPSQYLELPSGDHGLNGYKGPMWDAWQRGSLEWLASLKFIPASDATAASP